jgi:hypothetical protein
MSDEAEVEKLKRYQRHSALAVPIHSAMVLAVGLIGWGLLKVVSFPGWIIIVPLFVTSLAILGDVVNYFYCGHRIRKLQRSGD